MLALRAEGKLAEARFFLRLLARTKGKLPRAAYYASATVQALRAVTWVLQADLRPRFGARFDQWWEGRRLDLGNQGAAFPVVRDARNESTKKGTPLVRQVRRAVVSNGPVSSIEYLIDPGHETLANFRIQFDRPFARVDLEAEDASESMAAVVRDMESLIEAIRGFGESWGKSTSTLDQEFGGSTPLPFDNAVAMLKAYSMDLERLLADARRQFAT